MHPLTCISKRSLYLASASPRRKQLLAMLGIDFKVISVNADETWPCGLSADKAAICLAERKADLAPVLILEKDFVCITADTIVVKNNLWLAKAADEKEAQEMLRMLSDDVHEVITGVCIQTPDKRISFASLTKVWFHSLSKEEINYYIRQYKPFDKAGAYGIQEWIGAIGVKRVEGCYFNVVGLPLHDLYHHLKNLA